MPSKPLHSCNYHGCPALTKERYCEAHKKQTEAQYEKGRGNSGERGYDARWQKIRLMKLARDPLCEQCLFMGRDEAAVMVHHRDRNPHNNGWDNLESLCNPCHDAEHQKERWKR